MAKSLIDLYRDEYELASNTIVPFLNRNWEALDLVDPTSSARDGRITKEELLLAHQQALIEERSKDVTILNAILKRYSTICRSYDYIYSVKNATSFGFSLSDVHQYTQMINPELKRRVTPEKRTITPRLDNGNAISL
ncbi:MAG: hypothetical protein Q8T09_15995 [Candidatus Melainabacteria bacterium]|nr:hypothetical protein [Candidatus Melainabacteria bacterium]